MNIADDIEIEEDFSTSTASSSAPTSSIGFVYTGKDSSKGIDVTILVPCDHSYLCNRFFKVILVSQCFTYFLQKTRKVIGKNY